MVPPDPMPWAYLGVQDNDLDVCAVPLEDLPERVVVHVRGLIKIQGWAARRGETVFEQAIEV